MSGEWFVHFIVHSPVFENHSDSCLFQILMILHHSDVDESFYLNHFSLKQQSQLLVYGKHEERVVEGCGEGLLQTLF